MCAAWFHVIAVLPRFRITAFKPIPQCSRMVFIRIRYGGKIETIPEISKMATIRQMQKEITELTDLTSKEQRLFFRGKELGTHHTPSTKASTNYLTYIQVQFIFRLQIHSVWLRYRPKPTDRGPQAGQIGWCQKGEESGRCRGWRQQGEWGQKQYAQGVNRRYDLVWISTFTDLEAVGCTFSLLWC